MTSVSVFIPCYDDLPEAVALASTIRAQWTLREPLDCVLVALDPNRVTSPDFPLPDHSRVLFCASYRGLPHAKNLALRESRADLVLFLYPGLTPTAGALTHMVEQLRRNPAWGGVVGRWIDPKGNVEKGYNIRRFPTFKAILNDILLINKLAPSNRATRAYKMHDFDHSALLPAEHANDSMFLASRALLLSLGGFDESYRFGWFDQLQMCRKILQQRRPIYFDPGSVFVSNGREPLVNRMIVDYYLDFYLDHCLFVRREFGPAGHLIFNAALIAGMALRLAFACTLPRAVRLGALRKFRSYVDDDYIHSMSSAYRSVLENRLRALWGGITR